MAKLLTSCVLINWEPRRINVGAARAFLDQKLPIRRVYWAYGLPRVRAGASHALPVGLTSTGRVSFISLTVTRLTTNDMDNLPKLGHADHLKIQSWPAFVDLRGSAAPPVKTAATDFPTARLCPARLLLTQCYVCQDMIPERVSGR